MNTNENQNAPAGVTAAGVVSSPLFAAFSTLGRELFAKVADHVADGECDEWCDEVMERAAKLGLVRREEWHPQKHAHIDGSPGDLVWMWDHLPDGWREGRPAWECTTMDGQRIESDPGKRGYLRIYDRERFAQANDKVRHGGETHE